MQERFWGKVVCDLGTQCWLWTASALSSHAGYGGFTVKRQSRLAHRVAWELAFGPIPAGLNVLHSCDVRLCVRPEHLFLGTQLANVADRDAKGRQARGETHVNAKLRAEDVRTIRARWSSGLSTQQQLADLYHVRPAQIANIVHHRSWKHIT